MLQIQDTVLDSEEEYTNTVQPVPQTELAIRELKQTNAAAVTFKFPFN